MVVVTDLIGNADREEGGRWLKEKKEEVEEEEEKKRGGEGDRILQLKEGRGFRLLKYVDLSIVLQLPRLSSSVQFQRGKKTLEDTTFTSLTNLYG